MSVKQINTDRLKLLHKSQNFLKISNSNHMLPAQKQNHFPHNGTCIILNEHAKTQSKTTLTLNVKKTHDERQQCFLV